VSEANELYRGFLDALSPSRSNVPVAVRRQRSMRKPRCGSSSGDCSTPLSTRWARQALRAIPGSTARATPAGVVGALPSRSSQHAAHGSVEAIPFPRQSAPRGIAFRPGVGESRSGVWRSACERRARPQAARTERQPILAGSERDPKANHDRFDGRPDPGWNRDARAYLFELLGARKTSRFTRPHETRLHCCRESLQRPPPSPRSGRSQ
jgi:hypothetical protein